jgi:hypothetical protein
VRRGDPSPDVGDKAISVHTHTVASVHGKISEIDTRIPPDTMHEVDLADALRAHRPTVLLFATPALCESRTCGPVTDEAEQLHAKYGERVVFIHQEIYKDNDVTKGLRPQVTAWHLPKEPWVYTINSRGRIAARIQGPFTVPELDAAIRHALD